MKQRVDSVAESCLYHLRQLRSARRSLPEALRTLVQAFVVSRIDSCNAVLYGVAAYIIRRLQSVLHASTRLICGVLLCQHIKPTLRDTLHWLPIAQRVQYKIAMMAFNCVCDTCPVYFCDICCPVASVDARTRLRSSNYGDQVKLRTNTMTYGPRSFRISAPNIWNKLPTHLRAGDLSQDQFAAGLRRTCLRALTRRRRFCEQYCLRTADKSTFINIIIIIIIITRLGHKTKWPVLRRDRDETLIHLETLLRPRPQPCVLLSDTEK